ncbi:MAG TPA: LPS export ABC transporter periplasmic protein LptC [Thermoanaerobaculia bacterium]|jgi:lipopolysaccharide transport protein LptA/LPS export ABC transporter protein LptC
MARKARSPVAGLRKLLLAALVLCVAAVAGLFLFGKAGLRREPPREERAARAGKGMTLIGEDFDYTFTEGERPIFHIKGDSIKADREGTLYLEGVALTLYDKEGRVFHVESRKAAFNRESNEGQLQGNVFLRGPEELELRTARLDLRQKGNRVVSRGPVEIRYGGKYVVHAGRLQFDLPAEVYVLQQGARVESLPGAEKPVLLTSQRLVYERRKRWLRVEGGANLRRGQDWLAARRIFGNLSDDESGLKFVHAFWNIRGESRAALQPVGGSPEPTRVRFSGKDLAVILQPEQNQVRHVELEGPQEGSGRATLEAVGPGVVRRLTARRIEGVLAAGVLSGAQAFGGVEIRENSHAAGKPPVSRQANGQRGSATFRQDGQLATAVLNNNVTFRDAQVTATGDRAALNLEEDRGEFFGAPVAIVSDRGRMEAPQVVYDTAQRIANARGGVKALLQKVEETALAGTPLAEGEGPVHVESQEAFWRQQPSSFLFRGDVRAWRGENLLLAPELKGDKEADQLVATGGVKTLWFPTREQAGKAAGAKRGTGAAAPRNPIQVVASEMTYQQKAGVLLYTGNVRVDQEGKTLTCQRMQVDLGEDRQAETMTCTGDARVNDPKAGRRIEGQRAVYHVDQRQVDIFGDPVVMSDREGNQVRGRRALYYIDDGKVEVKGKDETPAPAAAAQGKQGGGR